MRGFFRFDKEILSFSNPLSLRDIPLKGECQNLLRRTWVASRLASLDSCATRLKPLAFGENPRED